jgi:RNA-directed DNA polymerase
MTKRAEDPSATVPPAQQAEAAHPVWRCAKPCVWTVRMLTALVQGVEGGKWFRLFDKVFAERNLLAALQRVAENGGTSGVDHVTVDAFVRRLPDSIWEVSDQLKAGTYQPQAIRRVHIPKPGSTETRPLGIPTVRDRTVQAAIVNVIEPIFERDFAEQSYGFRPGRGCKDALRRVDELLKAGYTHVVDADLKGYFDSIPHDRLLARLKEKIADGQVLSLIEKLLKAEVMDGASQWTPEAGAPQGAVLSPLLSNVYLDPLDHLMAREGFRMVRYADDFVILCRTSEEAQRALALVEAWVTENGLALHPTKTRIVSVKAEGFDFLGYHFRGTRRGIRHWARQKSIRKLKDTLRPKTKRTSGRSLQSIIADVNRVLRGWFAYFQHSRPFVFAPLDRWVRQRLRAILRKRSKRRGVAKGWDFHRWPNAFFVEQGLYSLVTAHASACQSSRR